MNGLRIAFTGLRRQYNTLRTEILDATDEVLRSGNLMDGNYTAEFSNWLAKKNQRRWVQLCHSGTQALEIIAAFIDSNIDQDIDDGPPTVIVPALTYPATANAWIRAGWNICILDTDNYGQMDYHKLPKDQTYRAVCLVGLYGQSVWNRWKDLEDYIVEDAAQHWLSNNCTRVGEAAAISFDPTKNLANYGNGGAVVTNDRELIEFARDYVNNGKHNRHAAVGTNSRMSEVDCAQMMIKTRYLDQWQNRRAEIARYWVERMKGFSIRPLIDSSNVKAHCFHKFVMEVDNRDQLKKRLADAGIETKIHYEQPLQELPAYQQYSGPDMLATSYALSRRCLSLPIYPELTDLEVEYIIDQVLDFVS
jgi:dTDP-4-amino-4,6-dideoxygalactose transaminase